jgi:effector-binding domain-containing protein
MTHRVLLLMLVSALLYAAGGCQFHPRPVEGNVEPSSPVSGSTLPYHVSNMRIQTEPAIAFLHSSMLTNFEDIEDPTLRTIASLRQLIASSGLRPSGPILFVYHDPTEDPGAVFELEIGIPVSGSTAATGDFTVRTLPSFRCATMVYRGPLNLLALAHDKLIREMIAAGFIPSDQTRESYLVWEGADSSKNVVQVEVGIQ